MTPVISKVVSTPNPEQTKTGMPGSESRITSIDKAPETRNPECEQTPCSEDEKGSESEEKEKEKSEVLQMEKNSATPKGTQEPNPEDMERPSDVGQEQTPVTTMVTSHLSVQPLVESREDTEVEIMSGSNLLITSEVEADNTIVSVGDYSFHTKSKKVMRK